MKNQTISNATSWSKEDIENYVTTTDKRLFCQALLLAASLAHTSASPEDVEKHSGNIRANYQELLSFVKKQIQGATARTQGIYAKRVAETELELNKDRIHQLQGDRHVLECNKSGVEIKYNWKWYPVIIALEVVIFICETFYNVIAFTILGGSILLAAPASLLFSVCLGIVAFKIPKILKKITSPNRRVVTAAAIALGMLVVFIAVGLLRGAMVAGNGLISSLFTWPVITSAILFVILNFFMFSAATLLSFYFPSDEDHLAKKEHDRLSKESKEKQTEIDALEARNRVLPLEAIRALQDKADIISEEQHQEDHIRSLEEKTVQAFFSEYRIKRQRERPLSLTEPKQ